MPTIGEMLAGAAPKPRQSPLAGVLPAVFSAGDKLKRMASDFAADPVGNIQQKLGFLNDQAGQFNKLHSQATQEAVDSLKGGGNGWGPASQQIAGKLADAYNPMGMVVWHGSPHKFSKFDSSKIGTGEGAQAYGHGLYLAESDEVAKTYMRTQMGNAPELEQMALRAGVSKDTANTVAQWYHQTKDAKGLDKFLQEMRQPAPSPYIQKFRDSVVKEEPALRKAWESFTDPGSIYKVDLPDDAIAKMLDWDKPLSQQAPEVKDAINRVGRSPEPYGLERVADDMRMVEMQKLFQSREGVEALRQHGIPGIRYLDGGSRGAGSGTSNFVVFPGNESLLQILERNGVPLK